jgi:hypothetical protein
MSPQPRTPFFDIITIPTSYVEIGMVMIGLWGASASDQSEKGATSILQNVIWMSPRRPDIQEAFSNGYDFYV